MRIGFSITYINGPTIGAEVHLPFGGVKQTGNGHREAGSAALDVFTDWKTVYVQQFSFWKKSEFSSPSKIENQSELVIIFG